MRQRSSSRSRSCVRKRSAKFGPTQCGGYVCSIKFGWCRPSPCLFRPNQGHARPKLASFGKLGVEFHQIWAMFNQARPVSAKFGHLATRGWLTSAKFSLNSTESGPCSIRLLSGEFWSMSVKFGRISTKSGACSAKSHRFRPTSGGVRPNLGFVRPTAWPVLTNFGLCSTSFGRCWSNSL